MKVKKLVLLILLVFFFSNVYAGLLTHLKFENSLKDSYGDNDGENHGVTYTTGKEGRGVYFNDAESDYLEVGENGFDPEGSSGFSISIWVRPDSDNTNNNCYIGKHNSSGGNEFLFGYWNGNLVVQVGDIDEDVLSVAEPAGVWTHYIVNGKTYGTYTDVTVFKNGSQIWTGYINDVMTISSTSKPWVLGQDWDGSTPSDFFKGRMDNLRFYDKVLTAEEVKQIYVKESSTVHLAFDDDYDDSAGSYDGTQTGGVIFKSGLENRLAYLDGSNDYIEFGTATTDPRGTNGSYKDYSISMWVKSNTAATSSNNNSYIGKHDSSGENIFLFGYWSNQLSIRIRGQVEYISTITEPTSWTHYVIVCRESLSPVTSSYFTSITVYRNNSQIWTGSLSAYLSPISSTDKPWVLGQDWDTNPLRPTDFFNGEIDNVRFYNRLLTASEVEALYTGEFTGIRYCNVGQDSSCTIEKGTVFDLSQKMWWVQSGQFLVPVYQNSIESIRVSEGWEAYLCPSTNNNGTCYKYGEGLNTNLPSGLNNSTYSMTVMPSTFEYALKQYGMKEIGASGSDPTGFAYLYNYSEYNTNYKRLFVKSNDSAIDDLSNYIVKNNQISSAELFGDIIVNTRNSSNQGKMLYSSHRDFSWYGYDNNNSYLDFRDWDNSITSIAPQSKPSVGWFFSNDTPDEGSVRYACFQGPTDFPEGTEWGIKTECITYEENHYAYKTNVTGGGTYDSDEYFNRLVVTDKEYFRFKRYSDSYDLLFFSAHGNFADDSGTPYEVIDLTPDFNLFAIYGNGDKWSSYIGNFKTKWLLTRACQSMGENGYDFNPDVINVYKMALERLNGVGGYRNDAYWGGSYEDHEYFNFWDELHSEPMSEAWTDPWSAGYSLGDPDPERDARYLTRENCDCNDQTNCDSYMFDDYFVTVSTGPKAKKDQTDLASYYHYCLRDDSGTPYHYEVMSLKSNSMVEPSKYDQDVYSRKNLTAKIYQTYEMPAKVVTELFGIDAVEDGMVKYRDDEVNFTLDGRRLFYKGTSALLPVEDEYPMSKNDYETLFIDDASKIAENLTTLPIVFDKVSLDETTSFIDDGINVDVESIKTNRISYIFVPVLDGLPMIFNKIEVQFDANGLYKIKSFAPYSVKEIAVADLKSQEEVLYEVRNELQDDKIPFDIRNIVYTIDEDGTAGIKYIYTDGEEKLIKTVSMEADYEK